MKFLIRKVKTPHSAKPKHSIPEIARELGISSATVSAIFVQNDDAPKPIFRTENSHMKEIPLYDLKAVVHWYRNVYVPSLEERKKQRKLERDKRNREKMRATRAAKKSAITEETK